MTESIEMGHLKVGNTGEDLIAQGIGSCMVITLYDPEHHLGGMCHAMLPLSARPSGKNGTGGRDIRYVEYAIDSLLEEMEKRGAKREQVESILIGGGNMFPDFASEIGSENIASARRKLARAGIKISKEYVGGARGRSVYFSTTDGRVLVRES